MRIGLQRYRVIFLSFFLVFTFFLLEGKATSDTDIKLDQIFAEAKQEFFTTITTILEKHFRCQELTGEDIERIKNAKEGIPFLFERIINIAYQKHEPQFSSWIERGDDTSLEEFRQKFWLSPRIMRNDSSDRFSENQKAMKSLN